MNSSNTPFEFSRIRSWVVQAGAIALRYFQTHLTRARKADDSPVTEADKAVEAFLIDKFQQAYPVSDYAIMAEESDGGWQDREFVWAIDPIDGTRVFFERSTILVHQRWSAAKCPGLSRPRLFAGSW